MNEMEIRHLVTHWQDRLGLADWRIRVVFTKIKPKTITMQVHRSIYYQRATIKVNEWVLRGEPPKAWEGGSQITRLDIEEAVVHELLHCIVGPLWIWANLLRGKIDNDLQDVVVGAYDRLEEGIVDKFAVALVASFGSVARMKEHDTRWREGMAQPTFAPTSSHVETPCGRRSKQAMVEAT